MARTTSDRVAIAVTASGGFSGAVNFTTGTLPTGVTANYSVNPSNAATSLQLTVTAAATPGNYAIPVVGSSGDLVASIQVGLVIT